MPIYEYKCKNCGQVLEKLQKLSDDPIIKCCYCNKDTLEKQISSNTSLQFKGPGWFNSGGY